jgi:hypothetical protein
MASANILMISYCSPACRLDPGLRAVRGDELAAGPGIEGESGFDHPADVGCRPRCATPVRHIGRFLIRRAALRSAAFGDRTEERAGRVVDDEAVDFFTFVARR